MIFKGKVDFWYYLIVGFGIVIIGFPLMLSITAKKTILIMIQAIILLIYMIICAPPLLRNYVEVKEDRFIVCFGLSKKTILIQDVTTMYKSKDMTAGSAASLDRIYISTKNDDLLISLKDNDGFMQKIIEKKPVIKNN